MSQLATRTSDVAVRETALAVRRPAEVAVPDGPEPTPAKPFITPGRIAAVALALPALVAGWQGAGF